MNRTRATDNVAVRPAPTGATHAAGYFETGTTVDAEWLNGVQEEICNAIEDHGLTLDTDDYEQNAVMLSGVHAITSEKRHAEIATTGVTSVATKAAINVSNAIVSGNRAVAIGGGYQNVSGEWAGSYGGGNHIVSGEDAVCVGGDGCTASGLDSGNLAGWNNVASGQDAVNCGGANGISSGDYSGAIASTSHKNTGENSLSIGCHATRNSGVDAVVAGGKHFENIDDFCVCGGYGASNPANFGDGLTNKNVKWKLHNDTGNAEFVGDIEVQGKIKNAAGADVVFDDGITVEGDASIDGAATVGGRLTIEAQTSFSAGDDSGVVDWNSSAKFFETDAMASVADRSVYHCGVIISNSDSNSHDIETGSSIYLDFARPSTGVLIGGMVRVKSGDTDAQKRSRWVVSEGIDPSDSGRKTIITSVGEETVSIAGNDAEFLRLDVYLYHAKINT